MDTVTLGNFDGIHSGHARVIEEARSIDNETVLVCFEPVTRQYFRASEWSRRLTTVSERAAILKGMGIESFLVIPFDRITVERTPDEFLTELQERTGFRRIVVGYDFHFGRNRSGTVEYLSEWCTSRGIDTIIVPPLECEGKPVKSERIRLLLENGELQKAEMLLGRHYSATGVVSRGKGLGRQIGFPTLNVRVPGCKLLPKPGSYAGYSDSGEGNSRVPAAVFVPGNATGPVEAHLLDNRTGDMYGRLVTVSFALRLRNTASSPRIEELKDLIAGDVEKVRQYFNGKRTEDLKK
jgi:riboflavin kinase / FMN adenylyltransferase